MFFDLSDGGRLHYERHGSGPPMVFLHSGMLDRRQWDREATIFAADHDVVHLDARAHGLSSTPRPGSEVAHDADLEQLLDGLALGPATLVGNSLGGRTAIDVALRRPDLVATIVLAGAGVSGMTFHSAHWTESVAATEAAAAARDVDALVEAEMRLVVDGAHRAPHEVPAATRAVAATMARDTLMTHYVPDGQTWTEAAPQRPALGHLEELACPVHAIVGELELPELLDLAAQIASRVPGGRCTTIPGVGHLSNLEAPDAFYAAMRTNRAR